MYRIQNRSFLLQRGVGLVLIILPLVFLSCGENPQIKTFQTVPPGGEIPVGGEISIEAKIEPADLPVTFKWVPDAGEVRVPSNEVASGVYIAPKQAGTYLVRVQVFYKGKKADEKSISIKVGDATTVAERPTLEEPAPTRSTEILSPPQPRAFKKPLDVTAYFVPSGWMGDGEKGETYVTVNIASRESPHSPPTCVKFTYRFGPVGFAAIAYQNRDKNFGQYPGRNLQGAKKITFWARGMTGKEVVEFKAGDMMDTQPYRDSFGVLTGPVALEKTWKQYELDLTGEDLSSVISGFVWAAARAGNIDLNEITFFLDDIKYE